MMMTAPRRMLTTALLLMVVAGCGSAGPHDPVAKDDRTAVSPDVEVTCGGDVAWPVSAMAGGIPRAESSDLVPALTKLAEDAGIDAPRAFQKTRVEDATWFVLARDGHAAAVAVGPWSDTGPEESAQIVYLEHVDAGWKATGWGDCRRLQPLAADGEQWVEISGVSGNRDTAEPTLLINEIECTSGRDPRPFLLDPRVIETDDSVTVSWTSRAVTSAANCIGNQPVPAPVTLKTPLGDRKLYDGSSWPAREVG